MVRLLDPAGNGTAVAISAAGLAGVGKTALAVEAAHAAQDRGWFRGGILFIDLHGYDETPIEPAQALDTFLRALGTAPEHIPPDAETRAGHYRSALASINEPMLVIADNASSEAQVRPLLPGSGPHRLVITSRHTLAGLDARLLDVKILDDEDGLDLLEVVLRTARPDDSRIRSNREAAARLAEICGGLPLALQIVAALLKADPTRTPGELAEELAEERVRLERLRYDDGSGARAPSVAAAFQLSYRHLDDISRLVFRALSANPGPDLSTEVAAVVSNLPTTETRNILADLARAHLIEGASAETVRWRMHDLIRLYARQLTPSDDLNNVRTTLLEYYLAKADAAYDHLNALPGTQVPHDFTDREEALKWFEAERHNIVASVGMAASTGQIEKTVHLANRVADFLAWRRYFDDMMNVSILGLEAARRLRNPLWQGMELMELSSAYEGMHRFEEAIRGCQGAATIFHEIDDRTREARALTHLGVAYVETHRPREAIAVCQKAIQIFQQTGDLQDEGFALVNLGNGLQEVQNYKEAVSAYQKAKGIFRRVGDLYGEGMALGNLGVALQKMQRFAESIKPCERAVTLYQQVGNRHSEATAVANISVALQELQRFDDAISTSKDALAIFRETGDRHGEAKALINLGSSLLKMRQSEEAIAACQEALTIFRGVQDRYGEGRALDNLGSALLSIGHHDDAIAAYREALAISREIGDRHTEGMIIAGLGGASLSAGRFDDAINAYQEAITLFRETRDRRNERAAVRARELAHRARQAQVT